MTTNVKKTSKTSKKTVQTEKETSFVKYESKVGTIEKISSGIEIFSNMEETAVKTMSTIGSNAEKQRDFTDSLKTAERETKIRAAKRKAKKAEKDGSIEMSKEEEILSKMDEELTDEQLKVMKAEQAFLLSAVKIGGKRRGKAFFF